jgi:NCS2 family nucleobase:cation symporter-2
MLVEEGAPAGTNLLVQSLRYTLEDRPPPITSFLFGVQHVLIMFTAMIASPLVIGGMLNLPPDQRGSMMTGVMLGCGVGTLVSSLGFFWIGGRLPLVLGAYVIYIAPVVAIARTESLAAVSTALVIGAFALLAVSPAIGKLRALFPPLVVGTLLIMTGESLIKVAAGIAFGVNTPYFGNPLTFIYLVGSIVFIVAINMLTKGTTKSLSIFLTVVCIYLVSIPMGLTNLKAIADAPWLRLPRLVPYGLAWPSTGAIATIVIYYFVTAIYTMSITLALCKMLGIDASETRVRGAVAADGFGSVVATLFGGVPIVSYDQNVGAISLTGVGSRFVVASAGALLVVMALIPKIGLAIGVVPTFVLGGTLIFMFGMIVVVGVSILTESLRSQRDLLIVAASVALSTTISFAPAAVFDIIPPSVRLLANDGIIIGTLIAVLLNLAIPKGKFEELKRRAPAGK